MNNKLFIAMILMLLSSCRPGVFTADELSLINSEQSSAVMRVLTENDPGDLDFLRRKSNDLPREAAGTQPLIRLMERMLATVTDPEQDGVGIAAPQVGISRRLIAVQRLDLEEKPFEFYLNPIIVESSEQTQVGMEGCLSVPGEYGSVERACSIVVRWNDPYTFELMEETIEGFTAVIFQHETDHLDGILFTDKLVDQKDEEQD